MQINSVNNTSNFSGMYSAKIINPVGLHMFPCGVIAKITKSVGMPIYFSTKTASERNVCGSLLGVLTLEPVSNKDIFVRVGDNYPQKGLKAVLDCISAKDDNAINRILTDFQKS